MNARNVLALTLLAAPLFGQEIRTDIMYAPVPDGGMPVAAHAQLIEMVGKEFAFGPATNVKGAPFSADEVTETTQTLADGNRIVNRQQGAYYRDSEGRTRVEHSMLGPGSSAGDKASMIAIIDPVGGLSYSFHSNAREAHKFALNAPVEGLDQVRQHIAKMKAEAAASGASEHNMAMKKVTPEFAKDALGTQTIEGVTAQGTRSTQTFAAGAFGNERPIVATTETWFSPELQMVILTRHVDPRFGETVHKLTNIRKGEPDAALFSVPASYTVTDGPAHQVFFKSQQQ